jgi:hypothetical protein
MTIPLWDSRQDLDAIEARAAQLREGGAGSFGTAVPPVAIYQVEIADQA